MRNPRIGRGLAILAVAALAVAVVSPAFSAAPVTKAKVKRIARKQINQLVPRMIDEATIDQGVIPTVTASQDDPNKTVFTKGPFTITLDCSPGVELTLNVSTTEENSVVNDGFVNIAGDLDPSDGEQLFANYTGNATGGDAVTNGNLYFEYAAFTAPSGTNFYAQFHTITNFNGNDCYVAGWFLDLAA
jgi:hypothetical protein